MSSTKYAVYDKDEPQTLRDKTETWLINRIGIWITLDWWCFVLDDSRCPDKTHGDDEWLNGRVWRWIQNHDWRWSWWISSKLAYLFRCQCRARNHPYGVRWYDISGLEPDMHCYGCGEDLG